MKEKIIPRQKLLKLDELMRAGRIIQDEQTVAAIALKYTGLLKAVFKAGMTDKMKNTPHYANGLNALSALSRSAIPADKTIFSDFAAFGAKDSTAFLFAGLMSDWTGHDHYRALLAAKVSLAQNEFNRAVDTLAKTRSQIKPAQTAANSLTRDKLISRYKNRLNTLAAKVAALTFLNGLHLLEGEAQKAYRVQSALLSTLFNQVEFHQNFSKTYGAKITAVRDDYLLKEPLFLSVELAGLFTQKISKKGHLDINHAPTIHIKGQFHAPCGPMAKNIDSRNKPNNLLFTNAEIYFNSLMDEGNSPQNVAKAFSMERQLRKILSKYPLTPEINKDLDDTQAFFKDLGNSSFCDIKRLYLIERLLRRAVLPKKLPDWMRQLVTDSFRHEKAYLARINKAGGVKAIFQDYRRLPQKKIQAKMGGTPFFHPLYLRHPGADKDGTS